MSMELVQVRLPKEMIKDIKKGVKRGYYATKSDLIRDAVRKLLLRKNPIIGDNPSIKGKKFPQRSVNEFDYVH